MHEYETDEASSGFADRHNYALQSQYLNSSLAAFGLPPLSLPSGTDLEKVLTCYLHKE